MKPTLGSQLDESFRGSLGTISDIASGALVLLTAALPWLAIIAAGAFATRLILRQRAALAADDE